MVMAKFYPYLRAKTFDLIAVVHAAPKLVKNGKILPVLEPVRLKTQPLVSRAALFARAGLPVSLIMNPQVGQLYGTPHVTVQLLADMRATNATVVPALIVHTQLQVSEIRQFQAHIQGGQSIYVHRDAVSGLVLAALQSSPPTENVFVNGGTSAAYQSSFPTRALLRDGFRAQTKNANYPPLSFFSDLHLTYLSNGYAGFGDFSITGDAYVATGGPAYAIAIHMTEDKETHGIFCNHFLSTSNLTTANPPGKFSQAVAALVSYSNAHPGAIDFSNAYAELLQHHNAGTFPGLPDLKRLSIQHHLELMTTLV